MFKKLLSSVFGNRSPQQALRVGPLLTDTYELSLPDGWLIQSVGRPVSAIRGSRGEVVQISSYVVDPNLPGDFEESLAILRETAGTILEQYLKIPELSVVEGPTDRKSPSGTDNREVLCRAPNGNYVAAIVVHGPRSSVLATLDGSPDEESVETFRKFVTAISFNRSQ